MDRLAMPDKRLSGSEVNAGLKKRWGPLITSSAQHLRSRLGKVCIALTGSTTAEVIERATSALKESAFVEFRLDYLEKPALAVTKIRQFLAEHTATTAIATCRRAENGGKFQGSVAAQLEVLIKAAQTGGPGE